MPGTVLAMVKENNICVSLNAHSMRAKIMAVLFITFYFLPGPVPSS